MGLTIEMFFKSFFMALSGGRTIFAVFLS